MTLKAPYTVTDDKAAVTCPSTPASLAPRCVDDLHPQHYTITQADLEAGLVKNTATGHAFRGTNAGQLQPGRRDGDGGPEPGAHAGKDGDAGDI